MVTGTPSLDYNIIKQLNFRDYMLLHTVRNKTNDNNPRSVEAIAIYSTGNVKGSWLFMSVLTGKIQFQIVKNFKEIIFMPNWYRACMLSMYHLHVKN